VSARVRQHRSQFSNVYRREESEQSAREPDQQEEAAIRKLRSDIARRPQYANANGISNDNGETEAEPENAQQAPAPALRSRNFHS
jgi:hypothetical protein